ncbi:single-stranded DNA-binding protein [Gulosibacter faecalis]|jgi:single-strand DNA-binding protein|uniref:Single-stranded DNA-binding protein n=1 Tax=Gulosibacter faecalis TaxID=272240 RepID=A0ABW5UVT0_9MICO|nr:single-stranded DNA-binding protein [Gulosibacter faecalis]
MAGDTIITVVGNLTADPELRYTPQGVAVANFTIASTPRTFDRQSNEWRDGEALFLRASVWRDYAEHVASSLTKGQRVIAQGKLKQRSYETREGEKRTTVELEIDEIGPSLRYATAQVTRTSGGSGQGGNFGGGQQQRPVQQASRPQAEEPWGNSAPRQQPQSNDYSSGGWATPGAGGGYDEEPPF